MLLKFMFQFLTDEICRHISHWYYQHKVDFDYDRLQFNLSPRFLCSISSMSLNQTFFYLIGGRQAGGTPDDKQKKYIDTYSNNHKDYRYLSN